MVLETGDAMLREPNGSPLDPDAPGQGGSGGLMILMPLYNDWASAEILIRQLDAQPLPMGAHVLIVDDGSQTPKPPEFLQTRLARLKVSILTLRRNLGHQRAICVGLSYLAEHAEPAALAIMDSDGEDKPEDVARLYESHIAGDQRQIIFAARTRRSEGLVFTLGYHAFRLFHRILTGIPVRFGNFSLVPGPLIKTLPLVSESWSHYAAAVVKASLPYRSIPTHRGQRIAGKSTMRLSSLVAHGISAISVFAEIVSVRLLVFGLAICGLLLAAVGMVIGVRLGTDLGVPGWATYSTLLLATLVLQTLGLAGGLAFGLHAIRSSQTFIPLRDYRWFVGSVRRV